MGKKRSTTKHRQQQFEQSRQREGEASLGTTSTPEPAQHKKKKRKLALPVNIVMQISTWWPGKASIAAAFLKLFFNAACTKVELPLEKMRESAVSLADYSPTTSATHEWKIARQFDFFTLTSYIYVNLPDKWKIGPSIALATDCRNLSLLTGAHKVVLWISYYLPSYSSRALVAVDASHMPNCALLGQVGKELDILLQSEQPLDFDLLLDRVPCCGVDYTLGCSWFQKNATLPEKLVISKHLTCLAITSRANVLAHVLSFVSGLPNLVELSLGCTGAMLDVESGELDLPSLRTLKLTGSPGMSSKGVDAISSLPQLTHLVLSARSDSSLDWGALGKAKKLQSLTLLSATLSSKDMAALWLLSRLERVALHWCSFLLGDAAPLLSFQSCVSFDGRHLELSFDQYSSLLSISSLRRLNLLNCSVCDGLRGSCLALPPGLTELNVESCRGLCELIDFSSKLSQLHKLSLRCCVSGTFEVERMLSCPLVTHLEISFIPLNHAGLAMFSHLFPRLQTLVLRGCALKHDAICCRSGSRAFFSPLCRCLSLRSVDLSSTSVDNESLAALAVLPMLSYLNLKKCPSVSNLDPLVHGRSACFPQLRIVGDPLRPQLRRAMALAASHF